MLQWLTTLLWTSEIVFLAASTPHIAAYYEHFDNPNTMDWWGTVYAWGVGYGLALTIDGVSFVVLMSVIFAVRYRRPGWLIGFLILALTLIATLSWFINWQYDIVFSSPTFVRADRISTFTGLSIGTLNPIIGGAFPLLSVLYALVAKALEVDEGSLMKTAMTPEQFENERLRLSQEQELRALRSRQKDGKGLLSLAQETVMGKPRSPDELRNLSLSYLRSARDLLVTESEERALEALSGYLKIGAKATLPLLIEARSIIHKEDDDERMRREREEHEASLSRARAEENERLERERAEREESARREEAERLERLEKARLEYEASIERARLEHDATIASLSAEREEQERLAREAQEARIREEKAERKGRKEATSKLATVNVGSPAEHGDIDKMAGTDTVSVEVAASYLGYDARYIVRLRNEGTLKHPPKREDRITVASLRAYQAKRRSKGQQDSALLQAVLNVSATTTFPEEIVTGENPVLTSEESPKEDHQELVANGYRKTSETDLMTLAPLGDSHDE